MDYYTPVFDILHTAVMVAAKVASPVLLISMAVGLIIAIFQAATSIQEQTITFVPKLFIIGLILVMTGSWIMATMVDFTKAVFATMLEL
ncbi:flagellar biosynthetic protein FliQ [Aminipila luticellarii]|uniref:Flagellar biosynthetic protein FliQ n=1 Tax=Aminipila luticellarii TaxID=2507160 RepID=A0A410PSV7_9FIRM|nr:flagellar biosynthetic protein FliQ [Aminipila luticellarii]QAT42003.1 flagellar biosynthetic protein FliQ [Aminipila luticellarii]